MQYAFFPTEEQDKYHKKSTLRAIRALINHTLFYGILSTIYYKYVLNTNNFLSVIIFILFIIFYIYIIFFGLLFLRNYICPDLRRFLHHIVEPHVFLQYLNLNLFFKEFMAMTSYLQWNQNKTSLCAICHDGFFINHTDQCILICGHKFHTKCIVSYEASNYGKISISLRKCPICSNPYCIKTGRFIFKYDYFDKIPLYLWSPPMSLIKFTIKLWHVQGKIQRFIMLNWRVFVLMYIFKCL